MRILLAHNSLYNSSFGGGDKSNRLLMEALAGRGHQVRVIARLEKFTSDEAARAGAQPRESVAKTVLNGVEVHTLLLDPRVRDYFARQVAEFDPQVIITSTDDPAQLLFEIAVRAPAARVVHLVRATIAVPFGPDSSTQSASRTAMLSRADAVVGVSEYVASYVREWGHMDAVHVPISLMEQREWTASGRFENPYVTMVNPCAVKGIGIFAELAERMPDLRFAAVPTWGTNAADLALLRRHANITVLEPVSDIDRLLTQTCVMLVPSVWAEARSRMVVEAMLGGVPVIASDIGGIPEAKLGVPYLIPVNPVSRYRPAVDENMVPQAEVPPQNIEPWAAALSRLTTDRDHWNEIASASRRAALAYMDQLSVEPFERLLLDVIARPKKTAASAGPPALSTEKKKLLALRLKQKAWFPLIAPASPGITRLFCFPHAGAGALAYRPWLAQLGENVEVCPVLLPGRESRAAEPPFENMSDLIAALTAAIRPYLDAPFAFFGHSMGAGIAFELARSLRRAGLPLPRALYVSAARAPRLRIGWTPGPEPSDEALLRHMPDHEEARRAILPVLRADARLYRHYAYTPDEPFTFPIFGYSGVDDPGVTPPQMDAWREQTTGSFKRREFPGGHFYLHSDAGEFLAALRADLQAGVTGDS